MCCLFNFKVFNKNEVKIEDIIFTFHLLLPISYIHYTTLVCLVFKTSMWIIVDMDRTGVNGR